MSDEETKEIERLDRGVSIKAKMKRGTGTRDQDTIVGKVKGETVDEVEEKLENLQEQMEKIMKNNCEVQPDE